ncbi:RsmB/NOP family class I SAM-dependent RNA methyltransferase [Sphingomonas solaris]|uniref:RsmB/NOP family class I SAM-dependent RNA methyltransferase n=1 Tax=Alterirhizorhabdus solaris TaxID=2529389 RepID=A0A558QTJ5_9SPHN|nr:RsmB/NOP family class I SAM-dependent RNA methyltransferase [Sphingomonas solaris]TVV70470.1 RsmB/NOP family class I SAM-dependent RNA methyltransferase [Sphingomonas solaris]
MTPAARAQAAIDLLDEILAAARGNGAAADTLIARYFKTRRYAGSKDRRAVRELVYGAIRRAGEPPVSGRAALLGLAQADTVLASSFDGSSHGPVAVTAGEPVAPAGIAPAWLETALAAAIGRDELPALLDRAPLDLRVNRLKATRAQVLAELPDAEAGALSPDAVRLREGIAVEALPIFTQGWIEIQDEGSQLIAAAVGAKPGQTVVDLCAGAGGKTLALAAEMGVPTTGRLIACDSDRNRLSRLPPRAERAGAAGIETRLLDPGREMAALADLAGRADAVLIDAPCSGTGTWRRNPEARWRLTPERVARVAATQARLMDVVAALVRPGGALVYAVCSLLDAEGRDQAAAFLARHPGWRAAPAATAGRAHGDGRLLTPARDRTDGFFIARLIRPC